ncbi:hypothetical protein KP509_20G054100 [Ceratopteris richardii]|uniref:HVA22-like protein n=1 Tax=Ceratopteris richardii TaxID=49495 RepID=A0A8T2SFF6_CERRI|nr:hypothetical protein KP509_20G054100 [Ceratopteris richardii]
MKENSAREHRTIRRSRRKQTRKASVDWLCPPHYFIDMLEIAVIATLIVMASILMSTLTLIAGYIYPACKCFQAIEAYNRGEQDTSNLLKWCQYWIIIALVTVFERTADPLISWFPLYKESKVAFIVYLWHPKTQGTSYVYDNFIRPELSEYVTLIDDTFQSAQQSFKEYAKTVNRKKIQSLAMKKIHELINVLSWQSLHSN